MSQEIHNQPRAPRSVQVSAWALVVVALALPSVLVLLVRRVLGGALDELYFANYEYAEDGTETVTVDPGVDFWDRWGLLSWSVPADRALLPSAAVCIALAGLHLAAGARWPLPRAWNYAAVLACAATAFPAAALVGVQLAGARRPASERGWSMSPDAFLDLAPGVSSMALVVVFVVVAGVVLLGPAVPRPEPRAEPEDAPVEDAPVEARSVEARSVEAAPEPPLPVEAPGELPRPTQEQYALYRRPGA